MGCADPPVMGCVINASVLFSCRAFLSVAIVHGETRGIHVRLRLYNHVAAFFVRQKVVKRKHKRLDRFGSNGYFASLPNCDVWPVSLL